MTQVYAGTDMHRAYSTPIRSMWDYRSPDHRLADMMHAQYFKRFMHVLSPADRIQIIDKDEREAIVRVEYMDAELAEVGLSLERKVDYAPATESGYQIRHAGGRGRGTRYQIVDPDGEVLADNIVGKKTAERELDSLLRSDAA